MPLILAGDVGGTKTVVAVYEESGGVLRSIREAVYPSRDHSSLEEILSEFLRDGPRPSFRAACIGVAGAVFGGRSHATNLPWTLDESMLAGVSGTSQVRLVNDLEAMAYGMLNLRPDELAVLNAGGQGGRRGNMAVIAAGTGLGEATLYWDGTQHHSIGSEGGHAGFAPRTEQEIELLQYLREKFGNYVSYERVLSGPGLSNIYQFLRDRGYGSEPEWLARELGQGDPNVTITRHGLTKKVPLCADAIELFGSIYGAEAGNMALRVLAVGGVFVGGGIAPKLLPALRGGSFMEGFTDKGRFADLLRGLEVSVSLNPHAPVLGAAYIAAQL